MSYAVASALQAAVYQKLVADAALAALVGSDIFDTAPQGRPPETYVSIGAEDVRDRSDVTGHGAIHDFTVSVVSGAGGFQAAKDVGTAISDALVDSNLVLARGRLVSLQFLRGQARRTGNGQTRRIDLRFRARVEDQ